MKMKAKLFHGCIALVFVLGSCSKNVVIPLDEDQASPGSDANPFFSEFDTPYGVPPFDRIQIQHYLPAFQKGIELHLQEIAAIIENPQSPGFKNTIDALDRSGKLSTKVARVFFNLLGVDAKPEILDLARKLSPMLLKHRDDIVLNPKLFARVKAVYAQRDSLELSEEENTLLIQMHLDFIQAGTNLAPDAMEKLRKINPQLGLASLQFGQNLLKEVERFELVVEDPSELSGLPAQVVEAAASAAADRGKSGKWVFTLDHPSLIPFLQYSDLRKLREKIFKAYISMGNHGDDLDNQDLVSQIVALRTEKAQLLGYKTYADFRLSRRMAKNQETVIGFLKRLWKPAVKAAKREAERLQAIIREQGGEFKLEPWDWWYYAEKARKSQYDLDDKELRPYFKLENVREGAFWVANQLYGIRFVKKSGLPVYHKDVEVFEVLEADGTHIGLYYTDYFPRAGKRGGAWCGSFRDAGWESGKRIAPIATNVGNLSRPTSDMPALLSLDEVYALFHEFGHALHGLFSEVIYSRTSDVATDFVELPSQIMENWALEPSVLKMYAKHYQTNEQIPDALIKKIERSKFFNQGFGTLEYLAACFLDMDWHVLTEPTKADVVDFEKRSIQRMGLIPQIVPRYRSTYFNHIFGNDYYAAGYYSYIWSGVLDSDAFDAFKQKSLFDQETARAFRKHILSRGGSADPMVLYKRFRGAEPSIEPLLKKRGFL